jgi:hypothetical protein
VQLTAGGNISLNPTGLITVGGITSGYPALKRSSTTLQARLADDSNFASLEAQNITAHGTCSGCSVGTQSVVTGSRSAGTSYQNTTGRPMFVSVSLNSSSLSTAGIFAYTDASSNPTTLVTSVTTTFQFADYHITFWVLPGNYYKLTLTAGTPNLTTWVEWY